MSMFLGASQVAVTGGIQVATGTGNTVVINSGGQAGISSAFKELSANAADAALHDSAVRFNAPRCYRNTRKTYLDGLECWMLEQWGEYADASLIWLNGGAGAGKSAIMQSIVERCAQHGVILGTFFFSRTDSSRNFAEVLIPTLAYQVACAFPVAMAVLGPIIKRNPLIFKSSLHMQAQELLIRPLQYLMETGEIDSTNPTGKVFVIDGLDECDDPEKQALIIQVVTTILSDHLAPVRFLIASRPELAISRAFRRVDRLRSILTSITLHDDVEASSDIRQFIEDSFLDIIDTHPLQNRIPSNWPESDSIDELVRKSSGHFIYAATAMKYISSTNEHPIRALQVVEGLAPPRMVNPFAELDALYLHILTSAKYKSPVLDILRHCILTDVDNSVVVICFIYPSISPDDVVLFLSDIQALVSVQPNGDAEMWIVLKHASLSDFFKDANRSHAIYMSEKEYRTSVLPSYFRLLHNGPQVGTTWLLSYYNHHSLMDGIRQGIAHTQDIELVRSLISGCSPQIVWDFCMKSVIHHNGSTIRSRASSVWQIFYYMYVIRDSVANYDNTLYTDQFRIFTEILLDDLNDIIRMEPQYRIIPALIFSSTPSCLTFWAPLLVARFKPLQIDRQYSLYFWCLFPEDSTKGVIDPRSYEAIRSFPQSQLSWGSDFAPTLKLVLKHLLGYLWTPEHLRPNPHARWLRRMKPLKYTSQGAPKLSSTFYSYLRRLPTPSVRCGELDRSLALKRYTATPAHADAICRRRIECFVLLKTVICYLHKSDCTSDIAKLARKSLPKAALWFPKLMKKARVKMDAYVRRWAESPEGLLEKAQTLSINDLD